MRFARTPRWEAFRDTSRKRAALARKQRLEAERLPLFGRLIREAQPAADAIMAQRAVDHVATEIQWRARQAAAWRRARAKLFAHGPNLRAALRRAWDLAPYPATAVYLADMIHGFETGRLAFGDDGKLYTHAHIAWMAKKPAPLRQVSLAPSLGA